MDDNPHPGFGRTFALPDHAVIEFNGRDAAQFAQAQFMSDITALEAGHWHWSGWLTPKGRVVALFAVIRLSDERLWLLLQDAAPAAMVAALQRYVFRSKVTIRARDDLRISGRFAAPTAAAGNRLAGDEDVGIELDLGGTGGARSVRVGNQDITAPDDTDPDDTGVARWAAFDLEHGLPRLPASQVEHWTPQQLSLERLAAFSIRKGCYPGQEIVARTHFLGKAKRGLALVESAGPLEAGAELRGADAVLGTLVATASAGDRHLGLAVVPLERAASALSVEGAAVREIPLQDGLAR